MSKDRWWLRNRAEYLAYLAARGAAGILGPAALARVGRGLGRLFFRVSRRRAEIVDFNLRLALPELTDDARSRLAAAVADHFGVVILDALRLQRLDPDALVTEVEVRGADRLESALAGGRGAFLLSAHIGSWEVAALISGLRIPGGLWVVNRPLDNPLLDAELERLRARFGNRALGKRGIARDVLVRLKQGGVVGILIDQRVAPDVGVAVPFFGQPTPTHPVLARFARKTLAPVVPLFAFWEGPGRYVLEYGEVIEPSRLTEAELEDGPLTARFSAVVEAVIRSRPEQWLWYHDRWRDLRKAAE